MKAGDVIGHVSADDEEDDVLVYSVNVNNEFEIDSATGFISLKMDQPAVNNYTINGTVQESQFSTDHVITIQVQTNTCAPELVSNQLFSVDEESGGGILVGVLELSEFSGDKSKVEYTIDKILPSEYMNSFELIKNVDNNGELKLTDDDGDENDDPIVLDYETLQNLQSSSMITVYVKLKYENNESFGEIKVEINDVNEEPNISSMTFEVDENTESGFEIGTLVCE